MITAPPQTVYSYSVWAGLSSPVNTSRTRPPRARAPSERPFDWRPRAWDYAVQSMPLSPGRVYLAGVNELLEQDKFDELHMQLLRYTDYAALEDAYLRRLNSRLLWETVRSTGTPLTTTRLTGRGGGGWGGIEAVLRNANTVHVHTELQLCLFSARAAV